MSAGDDEEAAVNRALARRFKTMRHLLDKPPRYPAKKRAHALNFALNLIRKYDLWREVADAAPKKRPPP